MDCATGAGEDIRFSLIPFISLAGIPGVAGIVLASVAGVCGIVSRVVVVADAGRPGLGLGELMLLRLSCDHPELGLIPIIGGGCREIRSESGTLVPCGVFGFLRPYGLALAFGDSDFLWGTAVECTIGSTNPDLVISPFQMIHLPFWVIWFQCRWSSGSRVSKVSLSMVGGSLDMGAIGDWLDVTSSLCSSTPPCVGIEDSDPMVGGSTLSDSPLVIAKVSNRASIAVPSSDLRLMRSESLIESGP